MKNKRGRIPIGLGIVMILAAGLLSAYNMYDSFRAGIAASEAANYLAAQIMPEVQNTPVFPVIPVSGASAPSNGFFIIPSGETEEHAQPEPGETYIAPKTTPLPDAYTEVEIPDYILNPNMEMPVSHYDGQDYIGILEIPAIDLKISVISEWSLPRLKIAPCRYVGSVYTNDMAICAHNYATHFGKLNELYEGAAVTFTDVDGNVFHYRVEMMETLGPYDVEYIVDSGWDLSLFTCTPGGANRVTIRCMLRKGI